VTPKRGRAIGRLVFSEPLIWVGVKNQAYRIAYTCENCQGQLAALLADLAIAPLPKSLLTSGFERLGNKHGLPALENYEVRLLERPGSGPASKAFAEHVIDSFADLAR